MSPQPIACCELNNGLQLLCFDQSKKIAADRWHICIRVNIRIPVAKRWFHKRTLDDERFQQIVDQLGEEIIFSQKKERSFVSDDVKKNVVKAICDNVLQMGETYFSHPDFAAKFILKTYADKRPRR